MRDCGEVADRLVERGYDRVTSVHGQRTAGTEIVLYIDDNKRGSRTVFIKHDFLSFVAGSWLYYPL